MKMKKIIAVLVTSAMILFTLAGCAPKVTQTKTNNSNTVSANAKEGDIASIRPKNPITLTVYSQLANFQGEQTGWFAKILLDKFNVKLNIVKDGDGVFATRLESGNLGDIVVFGNDSTDYQTAVKAGALLDWNKDNLLDDYGPYIKAHMQMALEKNKSISAGHVYGFGHDVGSTATEHSAPFYGPFIRWDLYKQLGYPKINTLEDFIPLLEKMQQLAPTSDTGKKTYGVSLFKDWDGNMVMFVKATAALYGWDEFGFGLYNVNTGEYQDVLKPGGEYLRMLKFYNTLYQKGLLDPNSMTQTFDDVTQTYKTGGAFFNIFDFMSSAIYNTPDHLKAGKAMMPLVASDQKNVAYGLNMYGGNRVWTIGAKTQYPELCMAIINWLSTPEGVMTNNYGPKGITWDYDKEGRPILTQLGEKAMSDGNTELPAPYSGKFSDGVDEINNTTWAIDSKNPDAKNGDTYNYKFWETQQSLPVSSIEQDWRDKMGVPNLDQYLVKNNQLAISLGTTYSATPMSNELTTTWNQVKQIIVNGSWKAIYAKSDAEFDFIVKDMTNQAYAHGYEDCVKYQQHEAQIRKSLDDKVRNK
ncbi:extracellular solute-binding protein [Thermoanaerobacterium butyriciformans]|uniref:Multiple sugar transport system substrate-binding protein/putative aldouronate transport system substrate-binding protein n=1 Tax=Thermoanaerobacterium butyriciformans TaxID=1702242 RepID=A0ABS4NCW8_9THEO|nr:multiple sugar transport system substrate-binding protein/putative aldouronate transport system substrate-binding protein [Thermoanaerobacterium butyriciformans]